MEIYEVILEKISWNFWRNHWKICLSKSCGTFSSHLLWIDDRISGKIPEGIPGKYRGGILEIISEIIPFEIPYRNLEETPGEINEKISMGNPRRIPREIPEGNRGILVRISF